MLLLCSIIFLDSAQNYESNTTDFMIFAALNRDMNFQSLNLNLNRNEIGKEFHLNLGHWAKTSFAAKSA
jgi:hypothetical protein